MVSFIFRGREIVAEESQEDKIRYIRTGELFASGAEYARTYYHYASHEMGSITHVVTGQGMFYTDQVPLIRAVTAECRSRGMAGWTDVRHAVRSLVRGCFFIMQIKAGNIK